MSIARVALDVPIDECFDFRIPPGMEARRGALVNVPFGRGRKVGVVVETAERSTVPAERLRSLEALVEDVAPFSAAEPTFRNAANEYGLAGTFCTCARSRTSL